MTIKILFAVITAFFFSFSDFTYGQDEPRIWREFIDMVKNGIVTTENIRPHEQLGDKYKPILLGYLDSVRTQASPEDWIAVPEIIKSDNRIQYIIPWTTGDQKITYCFSLITENTKWYFQHLEAIFIRLDKVNKFPTSEFPDITEAHKNWMREEIYWSFIIYLYLSIEKEKGKYPALDMLRDGNGYFVSAKTWVPFVSAQRAFILYLCWEQSRLRGNDVILEKLEDNEAIVQMDAHFIALYFTAAHLKPKISIDDYKQIFETIWQDRASKAGWNLNIRYSENHRVTMHFNLNNL